MKFCPLLTLEVTMKEKYELLESIREAEEKKSVLMEKLEKAMILEDMFPDRPFPVKVQISTVYPHTLESAKATFTFGDKTKTVVPATEIDTRFLPEDLLNKKEVT